MDADRRPSRRVPRRRGGLRWAVVTFVIALGGSALAVLPAAAASKKIEVVAAESQYGNVAAQVGGRYVKVVSVESNPDTDPHTYELSPAVAQDVSDAGVVVQNGLGYDTFMTRVEGAVPGATRRVVDVQRLLHLPDTAPNPHLWYQPDTMPAVAKAIAGDLSALDPAHGRYFRAHLERFDRSLRPWYAAIAAFKAKHAGVAAAVSEPVADYLLTAMGIRNVTPFAFQADVMNGTDPSPQEVAFVDGLFSHHQVLLFAYNRQVVDSLTESVRADARAARVPVVGVDETMPARGRDYQSWMMAATVAIANAVDHATSSDRR